MRRVLAGLALVGALAGCDIRTAAAPTGQVTLRATFEDAQHLVRGHSVRIADVTIGTVVGVSLDADYRATVELSILDSRPIPEGTTARLSQTSLLGENYIALVLPADFDPEHGPWLTDGDVLPSSIADPSLESVTAQAIEVLGAIEGGDLATIVDALATGTEGRGETLHRIIEQLAQVGTTFAGQSDDIAVALDGLGQLGADLAADTAGFDALLTQLSDATATLATQRSGFIETTASLADLARVLDEVLLVPHGPQLDQILSQLDDIGVVLAADHDAIGRLLQNLAQLATLAPRSGDANGAIFLYIWMTAIWLPGLPPVDLALTDAAAVAALLEPPS